jgi:hypothetical protein
MAEASAESNAEIPAAEAKADAAGDETPTAEIPATAAADSAAADDGSAAKPAMAAPTAASSQQGSRIGCRLRTRLAGAARDCVPLHPPSGVR